MHLSVGEEQANAFERSSFWEKLGLAQKNADARFGMGATFYNVRANVLANSTLWNGEREECPRIVLRMEETDLQML